MFMNAYAISHDFRLKHIAIAKFFFFHFLHSELLTIELSIGAGIDQL